MRRGWWGFGGQQQWGPPFGPWGRWSRFFDSGEVRLAMLSLLESGPKHGYQLIKDLEDRSGGLYRASAGAVYPTLQQMEDEGLLTSETKDGKRVYSLTEAGRAELEKNAEQVKRIWRRAETWGEWAPSCGVEGAMVAATGATVIKAAVKAVARGGGDADFAAKVRDILERTRREIDALKV